MGVVGFEIADHPPLLLVGVVMTKGLFAPIF
jgi:hypothetical protein